MEKGLDVSNYSGVFGVETAACWREQGFRYLVCGTQRPEITRRQLAVAAEAGFSLAAYVYLYWRADVAAQVRQALATVAGLAVERLWLDCEDATNGLSPAEVVARIQAAVAACGDFPHGIYTGRWWWPSSTGESAEFAHLPLWHAEYTASALQAPAFASFRPYGGWTRPAMWQYQGTTYVCVVGVDLNLRETAPVAAPPAPLDESERWELEVLRAGRRFEAALHGGRYALRPAGAGNVELVRVTAAGWQAFEPPCILAVD